MKDWKLKTQLLQQLSTQHLDLIIVVVLPITISPLIMEEEEAITTEVKDKALHLIRFHNTLLIKDLVQEQKGLFAKFVVKLAI